MTITKFEVIKTNDQPTTTIKIAKSITITKIEVIKTDDQTYDYDRDCQEHDDYQDRSYQD